MNEIPIVLVVAAADNGVIGRNGGLPWRLKSDMQHFRRVTMGLPLVMGRKTYQSIGRALPGRTNIVVSRDGRFAAPGVLVASTLARALESAHGDALRRGANAIAVIGGADLFAQTLPCAARIVLTRVHLAPDGDTRFPEPGPEWIEREKTEHAAGRGDEAAFSIIVYERAPALATQS